MSDSIPSLFIHWTNECLSVLYSLAMRVQWRIKPTWSVSPRARAAAIISKQTANKYSSRDTALPGFPGSSACKESACNVGDPSSIPGLGRSPGERDRLPTLVFMNFPGGSVGKESTCNVGDWVWSLGWEDPLERGHGYPLQYSCLEKKAWRAAAHGVTKSQTRLSY